ncbi:MAG: acyl-CoA thioesterase [bacterium]|nr:acyl-CoA thioesterase [bacterium]
MKPSLRKAYRFPVTVEFEDVDSYRIAHHTKLVAYLERARVHLFSALGVDLSGGPVSPVMYDLQVRFRKPAVLLDQLIVSVFVKEFADFSLVLGYRITRGDDTILRASTSIAFAHADGTGLACAPDAYADALRRFMEDGTDALPGREDKETP